MKKLWFIAVGMLGLMPLQGCMAATGEESTEQTGSAAEGVNACTSNNGLNPTRAALAVTMANEMGRWDPAHDLVISNGLVAVSSSASCTNNCANTKGILGLQDWHMMYCVDQSVFNSANFKCDMVASFGRQADKIADLTRNQPQNLPPAHKLKKVAGPIDLGTGACGAHYVYQADHLDGTALSTTEANNLVNALCFYGYGTCGGGNPYIAFVVTGQNCPSGRTCVAIDPSGTDTGSTGTTTVGAPSYSLNRLWDPANTMLNTACVVTPTLASGTMISRCAAYPSTCGWLYCTH